MPAHRRQQTINMPQLQMRRDPVVCDQGVRHSSKAEHEILAIPEREFVCNSLQNNLFAGPISVVGAQSRVRDAWKLYAAHSRVGGTWPGRCRLLYASPNRWASKPQARKWKQGGLRLFWQASQPGELRWSGLCLALLASGFKLRELQDVHDVLRVE